MFGVDRFERERLADAGALRRLSGHRHRARWESAGIERSLPLFEDTTAVEAKPVLRAPSPQENIFADYATHGLSLQAHPLSLVRAALAERRVCRASDMADLKNGTWLRHAGLVTVRQRPQTAKGITFVTLEDETGQVNVIVRPQVAVNQRTILLDAVLMGVDGEWQAIDGVRHLIARRLHDYSDLMPQLGSVSRDFH